MEEEPRQSRLLTGLGPGAPERFHRLPLAVEDERDDPRLRALAPSRVFLAPLEEGTKCRRDREGTPLAVLRHAGLEPHEAPAPVDLTPREREHLGASPSGLEGKAYAVGDLVPQAPGDRLDLVRVGEALADVVLRKELDPRHRGDHVVVEAEPVRGPQRGELNSLRQDARTGVSPEDVRCMRLHPVCKNLQSPWPSPVRWAARCPRASPGNSACTRARRWTADVLSDIASVARILEYSRCSPARRRSNERLAQLVSRFRGRHCSDDDGCG